MQQLENLTSKERLIKLCEHEEGARYEFYVPAGKGDDVVNALRMAMSRMRRKAAQYGQVIPPFKIYTEEIVTVGEMDKVILYRGQAKRLSKAMAEHQVKLVINALREQA